MRLFYQTKMYDYRTKAEGEKHAEKMRAAGWFVLASYEQKNDSVYHWTIEYQKQR